MKKTVIGLLLICMLLAACAAGVAEGANGGRQIASAYLDQGGNAICVTLDLSGGWSVEFAPGAFYLYDGDYSEDSEAIAMGITLDQEVFEEYLAEAASGADSREIDGATCYARSDGTVVYLARVGDDAFLMLDVRAGVDGDSVFARVQAERSDFLAPAKETATATLRGDGISALVSVDVSDGWSVEFATGAAYLYCGENDGENMAVAHGYVIDRQEYDENVAEYSSYDSFVEVDGGVMFSEQAGGSNKYLFAVSDDVYFMIAANQNFNAEEIYARFDVKAGE